MFKKYVFTWKDRDEEKSVEFFVHSKGTRNGFMHRACAEGSLPRFDEKCDWPQKRKNDDILFGKRVAKVSYCNRTWEGWPGQVCLLKLWEQLAKLKFLDMGRIAEVNPFSSGEEPPHEAMREPDVLFGVFSR